MWVVFKFTFKKNSETPKRTGSFNGKGKTKIDFSRKEIKATKKKVKLVKKTIFWEKKFLVFKQI